MVYYDIRTGEWCNKLVICYLSQELYFEVHCSEDDNYHHEFIAENGNVIKFDSKDTEEFGQKYNELNEKYHFLCRKSWSVPQKVYQEGLEYYGIDDE